MLGFEEWIIISLSEWVQNLLNQISLLPKPSKVAHQSLRAGQGVHQGDQWHAAWVPTRENEAGVPGQDSSEITQKEDREEGASSNSFLNQ